MIFNSNANALAPADRLIVALDVNTNVEARKIVEDLGDSVSFYKVGWQLFFRTHFSFISDLRELNKRVFLDLKMDDIPTTIRQTIEDHPDVEFIELMTIKGANQLMQAVRSEGISKTKFLMLTALSSLDDQDMEDVLGQGATVDKIVKHVTGKALEAGCDGLIASGDTVRKIRQDWFSDQEYLIVAPGIRPKGYASDDHKRILAPDEALRDGADYIVVGRPITKAKTGQRKEIARSIIEDIEKGREDYERREDDEKHKEKFGAALQVAVNQ